MFINLESYTVSTLLKESLAFLLAFCVGAFVLIYILNIPAMITQKPKLVNEYYFKNFTKNLPLDFLLVFLYFLVIGLVFKIFNVKCAVYKLLLVALITLLISGFFMVYFTSKPKTKNFFSIWFHSVGFTGVVYDIILLTVIYSVFLYIKRKVE